MKKTTMIALSVAVMTSMAFGAQNMKEKTASANGKKNKGEIAAVVKTGNAASQLLLKTLGGNLKKHMKAGGPADALQFCSTKAAELTAKVDNQLGKNVSVKRVTLKPRNPANEATGDEKAVLEALETLHANHVRLPRHLVEKTQSGYKYYKPLLINKPVCLKCHGSNIDPALKAKIDKTYPTDKATGYKMGDLRGAIVVTIKQ
jgi:hypothetical protein